MTRLEALEDKREDNAQMYYMQRQVGNHEEAMRLLKVIRVQDALIAQEKAETNSK